jgi:hypothetical protein
VLVLGLVQLAVYAVAVLQVGTFAVAVANYLPVVLLLLVLSVRGLRDGTGSRPMVVGIVVVLVASTAQLVGVDVFAPLDHDGLYHVIAMAGVPFLYWGGQRLATT